MDDSTRQLEEQLGKLRAPALSPELMARLEAAADGSLTSTAATQQSLEARLGACKPAPLRDSLLADLEATMAKVDFQTASTVLAFPASRKARPRFQWRAAAAVALLGALSALFLQPKDQGPTAMQDPHAPRGATSPSRPANPSIVPADAIRQISNTSDEGVIWHSERPHRVLKVVYKEQVTLKQADGSTRVVERPRVEYYLVPTESD